MSTTILGMITIFIYYEKHAILYRYYVYYNVSVYAKYKNSNVTASDNLIILLTKKPLTCKIDTGGLLLNPTGDITLDSSQSDIEWGPGDEISYYWSCEECKPLAGSGPCECNIFRSRGEQRAMKATILANTLSNYAKYTISLTITARTGSNSRTCYANTNIVTHERAKAGVKAAVKPGYEKKGASGISNIFFATEMSSADLEEGLISQEWTLIEVSSKKDDAMQYSITNTYLSDVFKKEYGANMDPSLLSGDKPIPSGLIPKTTAYSDAFPPVLGINQNDLKPSTKYVYALKLLYSNKPAVVATVNIETKSAIIPRTLKISPSSGTGYKTSFAFTFFADLGGTEDTASYQLFRLDCPSTSPQGEYRSISPKMRNANSFTSILAPGLSKCSYKVSIKLIATEESLQVESEQILSIEPASGQSQETLIQSRLDDLLSPNIVIPYTQALSMLSMISQAGVTGTMTD